MQASSKSPPSEKIFDIENERTGQHVGLFMIVLGVSMALASVLSFWIEIPYISLGIVIRFAVFLVYSAMYAYLFLFLYPYIFMDEGEGALPRMASLAPGGKEKKTPQKVA